MPFFVDGYRTRRAQPEILTGPFHSIEGRGQVPGRPVIRHGHIAFIGKHHRMIDSPAKVIFYAVGRISDSPAQLIRADDYFTGPLGKGKKARKGATLGLTVTIPADRSPARALGDGTVSTSVKPSPCRTPS